MKLLEQMVYVECFMIIMATLLVSMSYGHRAMINDVAEAPVIDNVGSPTNGLDSSWYDARATFYGDIHGGETQRKCENTHY